MTAFERAGWVAVDRSEEDRWHNERLLVSEITLKGQTFVAHRWLRRELVRQAMTQPDYDGGVLTFGEPLESEPIASQPRS